MKKLEKSLNMRITAGQREQLESLSRELRVSKVDIVRAAVSEFAKRPDKEKVLNRW